MAFRNGTNGEDLWKQCLEAGLAVIAYPGMDFDLSKHRPETKEGWKDLSSAQKHTIRTFAYEIKPLHIIYVKSGPQIVGKGKVKSGYRFDSRSVTKDRDRGRWPHTLGVRWDSNFRPVRALVGGHQMPTIRPVTSKDLVKLAAAQETNEELAPGRRDFEAYEGKMLIKQARSRTRNQALIIAKKRDSNYLCEVCGFSFERRYGEIGAEFVIAHHANPIGQRKRNLRTTLNEIELLCANCHAMIHRREPPLSVWKLRKLLRPT